MLAAGHPVPTVNGPESAERFAPLQPICDGSADRAVIEAQRLFQRTLAAWVVDLFALRRAGLDQPCWNAARQARRWRDAA
jgi:hypothetical protein